MFTYEGFGNHDLLTIFMLPFAAAIFVKIALDDLRRRFISNRWLLVVLACYAVLVLAAPSHLLPSWLPHLAWTALGLLVFGALHLVGGMAAGDVKLAGMVFLFTPPGLWASTLLVIALMGLAVIPLQQWQARRANRDADPRLAGLPYGVALAAGGVWACAGWAWRLHTG